MSNIIVFDQEKKDGLESKISTDASLAYVSQLCTPDSVGAFNTAPNYNAALDSFFAKSGRDDSDIYHTYSILVTTSWNKNDDVFSKEDVWAARNTPQYKPTNLEHDEKQIVGGIIGNWPVDSNFNILDPKSSAEELPDVYHLLVSSVIYRQWQDPEYQDRAEELIQSIERGQKFVSMECVFRGFDYAVTGPDNKNHILARSSETSFLTKHLRAYGGEGIYEDHKVGRLLRNITFSGKGYVDRPANPDSIIFDKNHVFDFTNASTAENLFFDNNGVSVRVEKEIFSDVRQENLNMSNEILSDQVRELKEALAAVKADNQALSEKLSEANVEKWETQVAELTQTIEALNESSVQASDDLVSANSEIEDLQTKLTEVSEAKQQAVDSLYAIEKEQSKAKRVISLVEAGLLEAEAIAKVEVFNDLTDEQFEAMAEAISAVRSEAGKPWEDKKKKSDKPGEDDDDKEAEATDVEENEETEADSEEEATEADEEVLETASVEEAIDLAVASEDVQEVDNTRASLNNWVNTFVLNKESGE